MINSATLFSGIGGSEIAAEQLGWNHLFYCEKDDFCRKVLGYHFPKAKSYEDITTTDFTIWRGKVDVLTGGFPCQPFSVAGRREGKTDNRYLWPEMLRAIKECRPTWVVGENVAGLASMVFTSSITKVEEQANFEGKEVRLSMEGEGILLRITEDLQEIGYSVQCFIIPAAAVGAPHRRDRVWIVAHARFKGLERPTTKVVNSIQPDNSVSKKSTTYPTRQQSDGLQPCKESKAWEPQQGEFRGSYCKGVFANTNCKRQRGESNGVGKSGLFNETCAANFWQNFPTQFPLCRGNDGIPGELDGITFSKLRKESLKAYGNGIVPQVVYEIFKPIDEYYRIRNL